MLVHVTRSAKASRSAEASRYEEQPRSAEASRDEKPSSRYRRRAARYERRLRGILLRLVRRRALAVAVGLALAAPAAWLEISSPYDAWWIGGLSLVLAATGIALVWTGLTGARPDWIDEP
jgi:hypothetical protein